MKDIKPIIITYIEEFLISLRHMLKKIQKQQKYIKIYHLFIYLKYHYFREYFRYR
jgi:hypothetical protein